MKKERGVSVKVSEDFYRMMERIRLNLKLQHNIKINSHTKLTQLLAKNKNLLNKQWINQIKNGII